MEKLRSGQALTVTGSGQAPLQGPHMEALLLAFFPAAAPHPASPPSLPSPSHSFPSMVLPSSCTGTPPGRVAWGGWKEESPEAA